jgi:chemotaxis protein methyltransferase CheR
MSASITGDELVMWSRYVKETCGIALDQSKAYLFETRLNPLLAETNSKGFSDLFYKLKSESSNILRNKIVDAMTTNETSFFRDSAPFELLKQKLIPELIDRKTNAGVRPISMRIWSAACSTGQEVYTIGIVLKELLGNLAPYDIRILGSDISHRAVAQASRGCYSQFEIERGLPAGYGPKYFTQDRNGWKIRDEIRALASFSTMNLLESYSFPAPFDIIFCRNVAIYFSEQDRIRLFTGLRRHMMRDASLIIGSTESLSNICPGFEPKRHLRAVYYQFAPSI